MLRGLRFVAYPVALTVETQEMSSGPDWQIMKDLRAVQSPLSESGGRNTGATLLVTHKTAV